MNTTRSNEPSSHTQAPTMPFGKYKGIPLDELPNEYLLWLGCLDTLRQPLLGQVLREMARRLAELDRQQTIEGAGVQ